jgi:mRNA-degrading endonuclease RelE of RelBE toxin-antitoxin system
VKERQGRKRYEVLLSEQAERSKEKLPPAIQEAIEDKLEWLAKNVHAIRHERLKGLPYFSLHLGQYRIAYHIDHSQGQIHVCDLGKHDEVYRRLARR